MLRKKIVGTQHGIIGDPRHKAHSTAETPPGAPGCSGPSPHSSGAPHTPNDEKSNFEKMFNFKICRRGTVKID